MREKDEHGEGRLQENDDQKTSSKLKDISEIDCQEGTMQRGETGGNFRSIEEQETEKEKNPR